MTDTKAFSYYLCRTFDIAASKTVNDFSYDAVVVEIRTHHLPYDVNSRV